MSMSLPSHSSAPALLSSVSVDVAGIDFKIRTIELDNKKIKLQIW